MDGYEDFIKLLALAYQVAMENGLFQEWNIANDNEEDPKDAA